MIPFRLSRFDPRHRPDTLVDRYAHQDIVQGHGEDAPTEPAARECAGCGDPCTNGLRWCSNACFHMEDGYPDDEPDDDRFDPCDLSDRYDDFSDD